MDDYNYWLQECEKIDPFSKFINVQKCFDLVGCAIENPFI